MGDASEDLHLPDQLMESGRVVVVTANYRLGPFGFLSLGSERVAGNQVLEWDVLLVAVVRGQRGWWEKQVLEWNAFGHYFGS